MKRIFLRALALFMLFPLTAFASAPEQNFAAEYAALNGQLTFDELHRYADVDIPDDGSFAYVEYDEVVSMLKGGTGVLFFGFPECPWCRCLVPVLYEAAKDCGYREGVKCFNALSMRDQLSLDENGEIVTEREADPRYPELVSLLYDHLLPYEGLNDDSIRRLYFPMVVFLRNGEIVFSHIDTVASQADPYVPLDEAQHDELLGILAEGFGSL